MLSKHDTKIPLALEALEWTEDVLFDEWWDVYVNAAVKSMLEIDLVGKLMEFAGLKEKSGIVKKKLLVDVDMNATSTSLLDMLNDDTPATEEKNGESEGADSGAKEEMGASVEASKTKDTTPVPGINVINYTTSNHAKWQAEKAHSKESQGSWLARPTRGATKTFPYDHQIRARVDALVVIQRRFGVFVTESGTQRIYCSVCKKVGR